jgi:capsular exopolysaccharide synthesis family protein
MELLQPAAGPVVPGYTFAPQLASVDVALHLHPAIRKTSIERLSLLPCGTVVPGDAELLEPRCLRSRLEELKRHFDVILIDSPPVLVSADAAMMAASADGVLLVVRAGRTEQAAAELAHQRLTAAGSRILGAVLNDQNGVLSRSSEKKYYAYTYPAVPD